MNILEIGIAKGMEEGMEKGIEAYLELCRDMKLERKEAGMRIREKFTLSEEKMEEYLNRYW